MMSKLRIQKKVYETVDGKENLSKKYNKQFVWKFPATSRGKEVVDGVGGNVKSTVHCYVMSKKKNPSLFKIVKALLMLCKKSSKEYKNLTY